MFFGENKNISKLMFLVKHTTKIRSKLIIFLLINHTAKIINQLIEHTNGIGQMLIANKATSVQKQNKNVNEVRKENFFLNDYFSTMFCVRVVICRQ